MSDRRERFKEMACELAETAMTLARDVAAKALAADVLAEKAAYAQAHERLARSVRLSIALCEKLDRSDRDDARAACEDEWAGASSFQRARKREIADRKAIIRRAVHRSIRQETEGETAERLEAAFELALDEYALSPRFTVQPLIELVDLFREALGLPKDLDLGLDDIDGLAPPAPA